MRKNAKILIEANIYLNYPKEGRQELATAENQISISCNLRFQSNLS